MNISQFLSKFKGAWDIYLESKQAPQICIEPLTGVLLLLQLVLLHLPSDVSLLSLDIHQREDAVIPVIA